MNRIVSDSSSVGSCSSDDESYASSMDSEEHDNLDNVYYDDQEYHDDERYNNNYYIGATCVVNNKILLMSVVSPRTFFKYNIDDVTNFLKHQSLLYTQHPQIDIIKLNYVMENNDLLYTSVNKTYYLRIIQKMWRTQLKKREIFMRKRVSPAAQRHREITGKWSSGLVNPPGLYGLMNI